MSRPIDDLIDLDVVIPELIAELESRARRRQPGKPPIWWRSIDIAQRFRIREGGSKDSRKRGVRQLMKMVAERRSDLIASFAGYAIATEPADLRAYQQFRRSMGLSHLVAESASRHSVAQADADGQLRMFG